MADKTRCAWAGRDPLYIAYHDEEWGVPQRDPRMLWEMLMLEGFQAGLAWITVLRKREALRKAFVSCTSAWLFGLHVGKRRALTFRQAPQDNRPCN